MTTYSTLREKLMARNGYQKEESLIYIPVIGRIDAETSERIHDLAERARSGESPARDQLFFALRPRLNRIGYILNPWPDTPDKTGIWDRNDVRQETWIVFVELLATWDGEVRFVPYVLARFAWRLRDRILRGIGKPQKQFGTVRVSEEMLAGMLFAGADEEPESATRIRELLEEVVRLRMSNAATAEELEAWLNLMNSSDETELVSPDQRDSVSEDGQRVRIA